MPLLRIPCSRVLVLLPDLWQGLTVSIAKLEAHGTSPKAGGKRPLRGLSCLRSFPQPLHLLYTVAARTGGGRGPRTRPMRGQGTTTTNGTAKRGNGGPRECRGQNNGAGNQPKGGRAPKRAIPLPPAFPGARQAREGVKPRKPKASTTERGEGEMRAVSRAGEKAAKGPTGRAPPQGGRAARWTRRAAFFSHSLEGVGTPAAHCGAGPHAGRRQGPHGDATSRPRGPPARRATAGPLGRSTGHERRRPAHGTPPGHQRPDAAVCTPTRSLHLPQRKPPRGPYGACGVRPQRNHRAHARAYWAGEGGRNAPQGVRGATPASEQARAAVRRARERERSSGRAVMVGPSFT